MNTIIYKAYLTMLKLPRNVKEAIENKNLSFGNLQQLSKFFGDIETLKSFVPKVTYEETVESITYHIVESFAGSKKASVNEMLITLGSPKEIFAEYIQGKNFIKPLEIARVLVNVMLLLSRVALVILLWPGFMLIARGVTRDFTAPNAWLHVVTILLGILALSLPAIGLFAKQKWITIAVAVFTGYFFAFGSPYIQEASNFMSNTVDTVGLQQYATYDIPEHSRKSMAFRLPTGSGIVIVEVEDAGAFPTGREMLVSTYTELHQLPTWLESGNVTRIEPRQEDILIKNQHVPYYTWNWVVSGVQTPILSEGYYNIAQPNIGIMVPKGKFTYKIESIVGPSDNRYEATENIDLEGIPAKNITLLASATDHITCNDKTATMGTNQDCHKTGVTIKGPVMITFTHK